MLKRHRSSESGQFINSEAAAQRPAETVAEAVKQPDTEAGVRALYGALVQDGVEFDDLSQETRDNYRAALKAALAKL